LKKRASVAHATTVETTGFLPRPDTEERMTRFDATDPTERRKLFADAVLAHRNRGSDFLTVEAEATEDEEVAPWLQVAVETLNLDCTDEELDRLKTLLEEFPEFRIDQLERPEEAEGANVRITARSDANRLAAFVDRAFQDVYGRADDYRAWVVQV
jgi:hypothetical protein